MTNNSKYKLEGVTVGYLKILRYTGIGKWECLCNSCGKKCLKLTGDLNRCIERNSNSTCGKCKKPLFYKTKDLRGMKFGKLLVLNKQPIYKNNSVYWLCKCSCENKDILEVRSNHLVEGGTKSCGCANRRINKYNLSGKSGIGYTSCGDKFYFDLEDYDKIKHYGWIKLSTRYIYAEAKGKSILLHRLVKNIVDNRKYTIDHIDRNPLNNKKSNLRICFQIQNTWNSKKQKKNKSGFTGVYKTKSKSWRATIFCSGVGYRLGTYENKKDAIVARLKAEKKYFGEFSPQKHLFKQYGIRQD